MIETGLALFFGLILVVGAAQALGGLLWSAVKRDRVWAQAALVQLRTALVYGALPLGLVLTGKLPAIVAGTLCYVFGYRLGHKAATEKLARAAAANSGIRP